MTQQDPTGKKASRPPAGPPAHSLPMEHAAFLGNSEDTPTGKHGATYPPPRFSTSRMSKRGIHGASKGFPQPRLSQQVEKSRIPPASPDPSRDSQGLGAQQTMLETAALLERESSSRLSTCHQEESQGCKSSQKLLEWSALHGTLFTPIAISAEKEIHRTAPTRLQRAPRLITCPSAPRTITDSKYAP